MAMDLSRSLMLHNNSTEGPQNGDLWICMIRQQLIHLFGHPPRLSASCLKKIYNPLYKSGPLMPYDANLSVTDYRVSFLCDTLLKALAKSKKMAWINPLLFKH